MLAWLVAAAIALSSGDQSASAQRSPTPGAVVLLAGSTDPGASETLKRALVDPDRDVRRAAARVASVAHPEVFDAVARALASERDPVVVAELVKDAIALSGQKGLPLIEPHVERGGGRAVAALAEWFARMDPDGFSAHLASWMRVADAGPLLPRVVQLAIGLHPDARDRILAAWKAAAPPSESQGAPDRKPNGIKGVTMRTPVGLAEELLPSTLAAAECRASGDRIGSAVVQYTADGRPRSIDVESSELTDACRAALVALARISTDPGDSLDATQTVVLPLSAEFLGCRPAPRAEPLAPVSADDKMQAGERPRLTKEVKPNYSEAGMRQKIEGHTEMTSVVYESGCVGRIAITRSLLPELDRQAIRAVTQWRFDPGTIGGKPVPMVVSIEMLFTLR